MNPEISSLRQQVSLATNLQALILAKLDLVRLLVRTHQEPEETNRLLNEIYDLASQNPQWREYLGDVYLLRSNIAEFRSDLTQAFRYASQAHEIFNDTQNTTKLLKVYHALSYLTFILGDHANGFKIAYEYLELAEKTANIEAQSGAHNVIGLMLMHRKENEFALHEFQSSLQLARQSNHSINEIYALHNLAKLSLELKQYQEAISYAIAGLAINQISQDRFVEIALIINIGECFLEQGNTESALEYILQASQLSQNTNLGELIARCTYLQGRIFLLRGDYENANTFLQNAVQLGDHSGNKRFLSSCYDELSKLHERRGDFQFALLYCRAQQEVQESWYSETTSVTLENLRVLYEVKQAQNDADQQRKLREEDRRYFEQLSQMKEALISTASHDLKNPLTSLSLNLDLLRKHGVVNDERGQRLLRRIESSINHMRKLITDLLDLAQLETGRALRMENVEIKPFVEGALEDFQALAQQKNVNMRFISANNVTIGIFDPRRIRQVLDNLVGNAVKYSPEGQDVVIQVELEHEKLRFSVTDHGIGIPEQDLPRIFEQFYRVNNQAHTTYEGTGLGLAIAKTIVDQHGGSIDVESKEGEGSTFTFVLPLKLSQGIVN